jgi:hypothetical protein
VLSLVVYILFTLTSIGFVLEDRSVGGITEITRCIVTILYFLLYGSSGHPLISQAVHGIFGASVVLWSAHILFRTFRSSTKNTTADTLNVYATKVKAAKKIKLR